MTDSLKQGDRIEIRGFGSFSVRHRRARMGRNPKTGVAIEVPPKRVPFFTVGHELRRRINADFTPTESVADAAAQSADKSAPAPVAPSASPGAESSSVSSALLETASGPAAQPTPSP